MNKRNIEELRTKIYLKDHESLLQFCKRYNLKYQDLFNRLTGRAKMDLQVASKLVNILELTPEEAVNIFLSE